MVLDRLSVFNSFHDEAIISGRAMTSSGMKENCFREYLKGVFYGLWVP